MKTKTKRVTKELLFDLCLMVADLSKLSEHDCDRAHRIARKLLEKQTSSDAAMIAYERVKDQVIHSGPNAGPSIAFRGKVISFWFAVGLNLRMAVFFNGKWAV